MKTKSHQAQEQNDNEYKKKGNNCGVKIKWTAVEDEKLKKAVEKYHHKNWKLIANEVTGRSPKQCLERWYGMLDPSLIKTKFTPDEDQIILDMQSRLGNKWSLIAECLPGRSAISVRNRSDLLKRHAKNPSLPKRQFKSNLGNNNLSSQINSTSYNMNFQNMDQCKIETPSTNINSNDKKIKNSKPIHFLELNQNSEIKNFFSRDSWVELDRFFSNFDDLIFWEKTELF